MRSDFTVIYVGVCITKLEREQCVVIRENFPTFTKHHQEQQSEEEEVEGNYNMLIVVGQRNGSR